MGHESDERNRKKNDGECHYDYYLLSFRFFTCCPVSYVLWRLVIVKYYYGTNVHVLTHECPEVLSNRSNRWNRAGSAYSCQVMGNQGGSRTEDKLKTIALKPMKKFELYENLVQAMFKQ